MALAPFFSKSALSASQILASVSQADFIRRVQAARVQIVFAEDASASAEGRVTLELMCNLLTRLLPSLHLTAHGNGAIAYRQKLEALARSINPAIELDGTDRPEITLVVGAMQAAEPGQLLHVGSDAWNARLSQGTPQRCGPSTVPFGAAAAACLAVANIFRFIFRDVLVNAELDREVDLSLWHFEGEKSEAPRGPFTLGEVHLAGAGAVGNGFLWTLARSPGLAGRLHVVEPERIDLGNVQRYVLTDMTSPGRAKTELAAEAFAQSALEVVVHPTTWGKYLAGCGDYRVDTAVVALDSARHRIDVQGALPRRILNAWTQRENLGVSRHPDFLRAPCLACLYFPDGAMPNEDEEIARSLKMNDPQQLMEIRLLLHTGAPLSPEFVGRVAVLAGKDPGLLSAFVGQPLRQLYSGAVCGGLLLDLGSQAAPAAEVPMPFQSALAGVMLAADLVAASFPLVRPDTTTLNLLRPLPAYLSFPAVKRPNCICADAVFRRIFADKWSVSV